MKKIIALVLALCMVFALAACGGSSAPAAAPAAPAATTDAATENAAPAFEPMTWKAATSGAESSNFAAGLYKFAELLAEKTDGAITLEVYPSDQLTGGNQVDSLQAEMEGSIDVTFQADGVWSNYDAEYNVLILPFLFSTLDEVDAVLFNGVGRDYFSNKLLNEQGVKLLGIGENGFRYITNNKHPISRPEDLKDVKMRVGGSPILTRTYTLWGADYNTANWAEVYTNLQTGVIDGQENPIAVVNASSIQEVQKYVTVWTANYSCMFLTMNLDLYNSLSPELQAIVDECGAEACAYQVELTRSQNETYLGEWEANYGIEVYNMTEEDVQAFKALSDVIYTEAVENYGFSEEIMNTFVNK